jgi:type IV pilus assembly protein PilQ
MKKALFTMLFLALLVCMHSAVLAAELLDVKPVVAGNSVSIEISADSAMTYTYYKVPGQARAVVDIANTNPEKVEPLIVVNKGAVSSISVDEAQISGIIVSRIIFNLTSESNLSVSATPDRKLLTVTFGDASATAVKEEPKPAPPPEPAAEVAPRAIVTAAPPLEEDPLGLDEPAAKAAEPMTKADAPAGETPPPAAPTVIRIPKLEPVIPAAIAPAPSAALEITGIEARGSYIEIRSNQPIADYKVIKLSKPERLVIDIAGARIQQKKSVPINKFGIAKIRIGASPQNVRLVLDSIRAGFPAYTVTNTENGLRINFK